MLLMPALYMITKTSIPVLNNYKILRFVFVGAPGDPVA